MYSFRKYILDFFRKMNRNTEQNTCCTTLIKDLLLSPLRTNKKFLFGKQILVVASPINGRDFGPGSEKNDLYLPFFLLKFLKITSARITAGSKDHNKSITTDKLNYCLCFCRKNWPSPQPVSSYLDLWQMIRYMSALSSFYQSLWWSFVYSNFLGQIFKICVIL